MLTLFLGQYLWQTFCLQPVGIQWSPPVANVTCVHLLLLLWSPGSPALLPQPSRLGTVHPSCLHPGAQQSASSGTWQMNELDELSKSCSSSVQICAGYHEAPQERPCPPLPGERGGTGWLLVPELTLEGARLDTLLCPELNEGQVEWGRPLGGGRKGTWAGPWVCFWPCF